MRYAILFALVLGAGCGQLASRPSSADVAVAVRPYLNSSVLLDTGIDQCQSDKIDGADVQVCGVCVVTVSVSGGVSFSGGRQHLIVTRENDSAAFRRAISYQQPEIEPGAGQQGVWVMLPQTLHPGSGGASSALSEELMARAGYQGATGFSALMSSTMMSGPSDAVRQAFANDEQLRTDTLNLVGACSAPNQRQASSATSTTATTTTTTATTTATTTTTDVPVTTTTTATGTTSFVQSENGEVHEVPTASVLPVLTGVVWLQRPAPADWARYFPPRAFERGQTGAVTLDCIVQAGGRLECTVMAEDPTGWGFGEAGLRLSRLFQIAPQTREGRNTEGGRVRVPLRFNLSEPPPKP